MTTAARAILFAVLLQGAIALVLLWVLGTIRLPLVARGEIALKDIALSREPWPEREKRVSNAFDNQFQLPVLFYLACGVTLYLGPSWLEAALAFIFVASRIVHAIIFATDNHVVRRFWAYSAGYVVLVAFWLDLLARVVLITLGGT